jgi:hypothetical protein
MLIIDYDILPVQEKRSKSEFDDELLKELVMLLHELLILHEYILT